MSSRRSSSTSRRGWGGGDVTRSPDGAQRNPGVLRMLRGSPGFRFASSGLQPFPLQEGPVFPLIAPIDRRLKLKEAVLKVWPIKDLHFCNCTAAIADSNANSRMADRADASMSPHKQSGK